jgi:hypothetical protein
MIYKYIFYSLLINFIFMDNISNDLNNLLFLFRYYSFFIVNLLFSCNLVMINNLNVVVEINDNLMKNYLVSNGIYLIDFIIMTDNLDLKDYYNYYNIPILIFKLIIINNLINLKPKKENTLVDYINTEDNFILSDNDLSS